MTQPKARRGRPPSLTREQIAKTVLDVGFANLTFAAVRDRLGVGETTLYRYAPDRDELVRMGLEYAYSGIEVPSFEGPWREVLTAHALNTWHSLEKYPGAATEVARGIVPPIATYFFEELCVILIKQGFRQRRRFSLAICCWIWLSTADEALNTAMRLLLQPAPGVKKFSTRCSVIQPTCSLSKTQVLPPSVKRFGLFCGIR